MMGNRIIRLFTPLLILWMLGGCKSKEVIVFEDLRSIDISTIGVGNASANQITFHAEILHLNEERVLEHGFLLNMGEGGSTLTLPAPIEARAGHVQLSYSPQVNFKANQYYSFQYYLRTEVKTYLGQEQFFSVNDIRSDVQEMLMVSPGQRVVLSGNFGQVDQSYRARLDYPVNSEVSFDISADGKSLSFDFPKNISSNNQSIPLTLNSGNGARIYLASFNLLGILYPPAPGKRHYSDPIRLVADGLPAYSNTPFRVIIGNRVLAYRSEYSPEELGITGPSYRLGYYNGVDTVIFDTRWELEVPSGADLSFFPAVAHPRTGVLVRGMDFNNYFGNENHSAALAGVSTGLFWSGVGLTTQKLLEVPLIADGSYPVAIRSRMYGDVVSSQKLEVRSLKIEKYDLGDGYFSEPMKVKGNFLPGQDYLVRAGESLLYEGPAKGDEINFTMHYARLGKVPIEVGYRTDGGTYFPASNPPMLEVKGLSIDSFYPTSGRPGDIITVKGRGLGYNWYQFIIGDVANLIKVSDGEYRMMVPITTVKGPTRITVSVDQQHIQSKDYFTIL